MAPRRTPRKAISHEEAWEKIQGVRHINNQHLKKNQEKALKAIKSPPVTEKGKKFHKRLNEVRAKCNRDGDHAVRLCCIGLTQSLVVDMNNDQWSLLLDKLEKEKNEPVSNPNNNIIYEQASLNGIASIFDSRLCDMIKKIPIRIDIWTAAVTMIFPPWNEGTCTLILDIANGADDLAMTLFGTTFTFTGQAQHIMISGGPKLTVPGTEFTLKGAKKEAIAKVFGLRVYEAIADHFESEGGSAKDLSENLSMTVKREGAVIEISLGLLRAIELAKILYT